jgi:hypothetical protein
MFSIQVQVSSLWIPVLRFLGRWDPGLDDWDWQKFDVNDGQPQVVFLSGCEGWEAYHCSRFEVSIVKSEKWHALLNKSAGKNADENAMTYCIKVIPRGAILSVSRRPLINY